MTLHDSDNHDGLITHLEPDILESEVKWVLRSITLNKGSRGDGIPVENSSFKSWKMTLWKCCTQYASKFGKLNSGHRTGKGQFSFQSQRKAMSNNAQTTAQLNSFHMLVRWVTSPSQASIVHELWTSRCSSWIYKRQRNQRSNCQHPLDHWKMKRVPELRIFLLY